MKQREPRSISLELVRQHQRQLNKYRITSALLGERYATQHLREIGRLHTPFSGQRTELDYTRYSIFLYPTKEWDVPVTFHLGIGVDHHSKVIKGYVITSAPSAYETVRLYKCCVLPKHLILPKHLHGLAQHFDVFGTEDIVAVDNGADLVAHRVMLMFMTLGVGVLRMPPARGDLKGTVERTLYSLETMFIESYPGYVSRAYNGFDTKYTRLRERAMKGAKLTVAEFEERFVKAIVEYNHQDHPDFKKPRIQVWRDAQDVAPVLLPTGLLQLRSTFALTYEVKLTREGVQVENMKFNSSELREAHLRNDRKVHVKLDPDDIRQVLVFVPQRDEPIEAHLQDEVLHQKVSLELWSLVMKKLKEQSAKPDAWKYPIDLVLDEVSKLGSMPHQPTPGVRKSAEVKGAVHAAASALPLSQSSRPRSTANLDDLLLGSDIDE